MSGAEPWLTQPAEAAGMAALAASLRAAVERWSAVPLAERIEAVARAAAMLGDQGSMLRRAAVEGFAQRSGHSRGMIEESLDFFLGKLARDGLAAEAKRVGLEDAGIAAPRLTVHWLASNTPWAGMESVAAACLAGSASFVKAARGESDFAAAWVGALAAAHPALPGALAVRRWEGGSRLALEDALLAACDALVVFGDDRTIETLLARVRERAESGALRFVPHGHRVSVAGLGEGAWREAPERFAERVAYDHVLEDQEGCLSPRSVYLVGAEDGRARADAGRFAGAVADALRAYEQRWPRAPIAPEEAARVHQLRSVVELRGGWVAHPGSTAWTVALDPDPTFEPSPAARFVRLCRVASSGEMARLLEPARGRLAALAWSDSGDETGCLPGELAAVAPGYLPLAGRMQRPPLGWSHDGASDLEWLLEPLPHRSVPAIEETP